MILTVIDQNNELSIYLESVYKGEVVKNYMLVTKIIVGNWRVVQMRRDWDFYDAEIRQYPTGAMKFEDIEYKLPDIVKGVEQMKNDEKVDYVILQRARYIRDNILKLLEA